MRAKYKGNNQISKRHKPHLTKVQWGFLCCILIAISAAGLISYGAYTYQNNIKSVVSTKDASEMLFSSNHLMSLPENSENYVTKLFSVEEGNEDDFVTTQIRIYNYNLENVTNYNSSNIQYTLQIIIQDRDGNVMKDGITYTDISLDDNSFTEATLTKDAQLLEANKASVNTYVLKFPKKYVGKIQFQVSAIPDEDSKNATERKFLGRILNYAYSKNNAASWEGEFSENDLKGASTTGVTAEDDVQNIDGFNYEISGAGEGTITLSWDTRYVMLSPLSRKNLATELSRANLPQLVSSTEGTVQSIQFSVGSSEQASRYTLQFYRTQKTSQKEIQKDGDVSRDENKYVWLTFKES